jgi:hypothetical protein
VECSGHGNELSCCIRKWEAVECPGHGNELSCCIKFVK